MFHLQHRWSTTRHQQRWNVFRFNFPPKWFPWTPASAFCNYIQASALSLPRWRRWIRTRSHVHNAHIQMQPLVGAKVSPWVIHGLVCSHVSPALVIYSHPLWLHKSDPARVWECVCVWAGGGCVASSFTWYYIQMFNWMCLFQRFMEADYFSKSNTHLAPLLLSIFALKTCWSCLSFLWQMSLGRDAWFFLQQKLIVFNKLSPLYFSPLLFLTRTIIFMLHEISCFSPCFFFFASFVFIPRGGPFHSGVHMQQWKKTL